MEKKYKNIPAEVLEIAEYYLNLGWGIKSIGNIDDVDFYLIKAPEGDIVGYPIVYGYKQGKVYKVNAFDTNRLLDELL